MAQIAQIPLSGRSAYRGLTAPILQSQEWEYDPASGYTLNQVFFGWDYSAMTRYSNYYNSYGIGTRIKFENGKATLYTRDATQNIVIDKWEMQVDQTQPSIFQNNIFNQLLNQATDKSTAMTMLRTALYNSSAETALNCWNALINGQNTGLDATGATVTFLQVLGAAFPNPSVNLTQLKQYFDDYNLGVTNFISGRYVLRHTTNAPNRWQANVADFNVECIYTIGQLLSETRNSGLWLLPLPGYLAYKIATYFVPNLNGPQYVWGALKERSSANTVANNRIELTTEYLIDQINSNLYPTI